MNDTTGAVDRCRGVLIGLAAGDKIGGPIRMAVRLAESLVDCGGSTSSDFLDRYLAWWREGAFVWKRVKQQTTSLRRGRKLVRSRGTRKPSGRPQWSRLPRIPCPKQGPVIVGLKNGNADGGGRTPGRRPDTMSVRLRGEHRRSQGAEELRRPYAAGAG